MSIDSILSRGRNHRLALLLFIGFTAQLSQAQESVWRSAEQQTRGDLASMLRVVAATAPNVQLRWNQSAAELTEKLRRAGRFRDLGLTDAEGAILVQAVFRRHGLALDPASARPAADSQAPALTLPFPYRAGTEFERLGGILLRWPFDIPRLRDEYAVMVGAYANAGVTVYIRVDTASQQTQAQQYLTRAGVPQGHVQWVIENTDSIWIRDYGPQFLQSTTGTERGIADFHYSTSRPEDDDTPLTVAQALGLPVVDRQNTQRVFTEGGNLSHDGLGNVIYSTRTYTKNLAPQGVVDQRILSAFQAHQKTVLTDPTLDGTGHVDMFSKVLNPTTVLVAQYAQNQVDYAILEQAAALLGSSTNGAGQPWNVVRIPQPDVYYTFFVLPVVRTYTNAQMANNVVIVPVYGIASDATALATYQSLLPGKQIIGLNANDIIESAGAWHCVTMEMPAPPVVSTR